MIRFDNVTKYFHHKNIKTTALNNINLSIEKGEFVAITGPSGCGKTTLLNVMGLLQPFDRGDYMLDDILVNSLKKKARENLRTSKVSFIFQNFYLLDELTITENIEMPLVYKGLEKKFIKKQTLSVMEELGIAHRANHYPSQLSGGQQQRVAIARAMISNPEIIFADEPTGNLDAKSRAQVMDMIVELNKKGSTIVLVTHDNEEAKLANRIVKMDDGVIKENV